MYDRILPGDRLILSRASDDLRRAIDVRTIVVATIIDYDERSCGGREHLARVLAREAEDTLGKAEQAIPVIAGHFRRSPDRLAALMDQFFKDEQVPERARSDYAAWRRRHPDLPRYLASLPEAAELAVEELRQSVGGLLKDFTAGAPPPAADSCGSSMFCAVTGILTGVAVGIRHAPAAIVGTAALAVCCTG
jgi:hypothetical protein